MLRFNTYMEAWEGINELFLNMPPSFIAKYNGKRIKQATYLHDVIIQVRKPEFDSKFDFGKHFNYTMNKWRSLINNYVNLAELKILKSNIQLALEKGKPLSIPYQFENNHKNGKSCLISLLISQRPGDSQLYITFFLRASEITKRFAVDLLLAKRLGDYLTNKQPFITNFYIERVFNDDNVLLMYHAHKDIRGILSNSIADYAPELLEKLNKLLKSTAEDTKYKVHKRAIKVLRPDLYEYPKTLAKDCKLHI